MNHPAIRVQNVAKQYSLGEAKAQDSLYETLARGLNNIGKKQEAPSSFWALKDISFDVMPGEVLGLIGRNGAGKSTTLKILSRVTSPTKGRVEIRGRMGSLLEVGTGFHPELSGRDNVFLNGAILGMKRAEIARKFDEIVAFAEVEKFIDTPVKRYSSGMYVRLAFSVAAHLETEILLVDEVLAVGDTTFQKKCLGKMDEVSHAGRTVVFISHSMPLMQQLCTRGIVIHDGMVAFDGRIGDAIGMYLRRLEESTAMSLLDRQDRRGRGATKVAAISVDGHTAGAPLVTGAPASFRFDLTNPIQGAQLAFTLYDHLGTPVCHMNSGAVSAEDRSGSDAASFVCHIPELPLLAGRYRMAIAVSGEGDTQDHLAAAIFFDVEAGIYGGRPSTANFGYGAMAVHHRWTRPSHGEEATASEVLSGELMSDSGA
jgi:lipopolysaccharide transport system ATP-binding protein